MRGRRLIMAPFLIALFMLGIKGGFGADNKELVSKGEKLYADKKCAVCHMINGKGGKLGGELAGVGNKRDAEYLMKFFKDPKPSTANPKVKMPPVKATDEELKALAAYILNLK